MTRGTSNDSPSERTPLAAAYGELVDTSTEEAGTFDVREGLADVYRRADQITQPADAEFESVETEGIASSYVMADESTPSDENSDLREDYSLEHARVEVNARQAELLMQLSARLEQRDDILRLVALIALSACILANVYVAMTRLRDPDLLTGAVLGLGLTLAGGMIGLLGRRRSDRRRGGRSAPPGSTEDEKHITVHGDVHGLISHASRIRHPATVVSALYVIPMLVLVLLAGLIAVLGFIIPRRTEYAMEMADRLLMITRRLVDRPRRNDRSTPDSPPIAQGAPLLLPPDALSDLGEGTVSTRRSRQGHVEPPAAG